MTEETKPGINLSDMALMMNVIDICSSRGAFKGEELMEVGQLRSKLAAFIEYAQKQSAQPEPTIDKEPTDGQDAKSRKAAS